MTLSIVREAQAQRIFPPINQHLYRSSVDRKLTPDQSVASALLASSGELTSLQKYLRLNRSGAHLLSRPLFMHRKAFEHELAGQFQRADFFWKELHDQLNKLLSNKTAWTELARSLSTKDGVDVVNDPTKLRVRFVEELLIDTHAAFFNGYAKSTDDLQLDNRAWIHLGYIIDLLKWSGLTPEKTLRFIGSATQAQIGLLEQAGRWKEVAERCSMLLSYDPSSVDYEEHRSKARLSLRAQEFRKVGRKHGLAAAISAAITDLEQLLPSDSLNPALYERLGDLHMKLALQLAKKGELARGLLAAQRALTFSSSPESAALILQLTEEMNNVKAKAQEYGAYSGLRYGETAFLLDEARVGFRLQEEFRDSDESRQIAEQAQNAYAVKLWRQIDLPKPADRWPERARKMCAALAQMQKSSFKTSHEIKHAWHELASQDRDLAEIEPHRVCDFLETRLLPHYASKDKSQDTSVAYLLEPAANVPEKQANVPLGLWLFSRSDLRIKLQTAVAFILLFSAGLALVTDWNAQRVRATSYQTIVKGINDREYLQVIEAAEDFLSHPPLMTTDPREKDVIEHYNQALFLWVARQPGELSPEATAHLERHQQLVGSRNGGRS